MQSQQGGRLQEVRPRESYVCSAFEIWVSGRLPEVKTIEKFE